LTVIFKKVIVLINSKRDINQNLGGVMADIGYVRVSTIGQNTERQLSGIELDKVFTDKVSGKDTNRPQLQSCIDYLRDGDTLHVHSLDRLGRSLMDLERIINQLVDKGVTIKFHKENLTFNKENNGSMGKLLLQILGAFSEFERNMTKERQAEGIAQAKLQGKHLGRFPKLNKQQRQKIQNKYQSGDRNITSLAKEFGVSRATIHNVLNDR